MLGWIDPLKHSLKSVTAFQLCSRYNHSPRPAVHSSMPSCLKPVNDTRHVSSHLPTGRLNYALRGGLLIHASNFGQKKLLGHQSCPLLCSCGKCPDGLEWLLGPLVPNSR